MQIYEFDNYKRFIQQRLASMPRRGRGELQRIAAELRMHTTRISHIIHGDVHLTLEQAALFCRYWGLSQLETEYFVILVQLARAGTKELKEIFLAQIENLRKRAAQLVNRLPKDRILSESERAIFYSNWFYSGIRLLTSIKGYQTLDAIAEYFNFSREKTREVLDFLVSVNLCVEKDGLYSMTTKRTHLEASSLLVNRHHANWRVKALKRHEHLTDRELAYTLPVSISKKDQLILRELLVQTIIKFQASVTASEPEEVLACLNIDWFEF